MVCSVGEMFIIFVNVSMMISVSGILILLGILFMILMLFFILYLIVNMSRWGLDVIN